MEPNRAAGLPLDPRDHGAASWNLPQPRMGPADTGSRPQRTAKLTFGHHLGAVETTGHMVPSSERGASAHGVRKIPDSISNRQWQVTGGKDPCKDLPHALARARGIKAFEGLDQTLARGLARGL